jgi:hypothetical protein
MESAGKNGVTHDSVRVKISEINHLRRCKSGVTTWPFGRRLSVWRSDAEGGNKEQTEPFHPGIS